jgi:hypothetical protein
MNYLKYIEYAAENLQFLLWYKDYCKRFDQLDDAKKALAPVWTAAQIDAEIMAAQSPATSRPKKQKVVAVLKGPVFAPSANSSSESAGNHFATPLGCVAGNSRSDLGGAGSSAAREVSTIETHPESTRSYGKAAASAFENANLNGQQCTSDYTNTPLLVVRLIRLYSQYSTIS